MSLDFYKAALSDGKSGICMDVSGQQQALVIFARNTLISTAGSYGKVAYRQRGFDWHQLVDGQEVQLGVGDRYQILAFGKGADVGIFEDVIRHKAYCVI